MTDEAKALVERLRMSMTLGGKTSRPFLQIATDAADYIEATEARHAAEMRELKERFREAARRAVKHLDLTYYSKGSPSQIEREAVVAGLAPFILPAPDPLVEAWQMAFPGNHIEDALDECAKIGAAIEKRGGKIVWEAGE